MGRDLIIASMVMARIVSGVGLRLSVAMGVSARGSLPKSSRILWSFDGVGSCILDVRYFRLVWVYSCGIRLNDLDGWNCCLMN